MNNQLNVSFSVNLKALSFVFDDVQVVDATEQAQNWPTNSITQSDGFALCVLCAISNIFQ